MADYQFSYTPGGENLRQMLRDNSFFRGVRGPVGSGKSVGCAVEIFRRASQQEKDKTGVRRTRAAVIRNTNPQLKTTTIKTWLDWFPEDVFGKFKWDPPYTHVLRAGVIECEVIFLALDTPADIKKLLSLELSFAWINEAREVPKSVVDGVTMRVNRFPSMKDGGATWAGVWADTNAPDTDHWWPIMAGEVPIPDHISPTEALMLRRPANWKFWTQAPGMLECKDQSGEVTGYVSNPAAENAANLAPTYYHDIIQGKTASWIGVYVLNRLGTLNDGKAVYKSFAPAVHKAKEPIPVLPSYPVKVGLDFGLTPAAVFAQREPRGRWLIQHELVCIDMGIARFARLLKTFLQEKYPDCDAEIWGDPAGDFRAQTREETPFQVMRAEGVIARPAPGQDPALRIEAVEAPLLRMQDGKTGILISPECPTLLQGFEGGYHYRRLQLAGSERFEDLPFKNKFSHVHDALQYLMLGGGEGRALVTGSRPMKSGVAGRDWDPFKRQARSRTERQRERDWTPKALR